MDKTTGHRPRAADPDAEFLAGAAFSRLPRRIQRATYVFEWPTLLRRLAVVLSRSAGSERANGISAGAARRHFDPSIFIAPSSAMVARAVIARPDRVLLRRQHAQP